ncbi:MAG: hypothetical protein KGM47_14860, partial [Acidobacteriota bacterium]|nr:hypothetical protein [Acidobacteriota bacterium]
RHALGTSVVAGMIAATVLAVLFVPTYYVMVQGLTRRRDLPPSIDAAGDRNGQLVTAGGSEAKPGQGERHE